MPPRANLTHEEPDAGIPLVRICEGWGRQRPHLLGDDPNPKQLEDATFCLVSQAAPRVKQSLFRCIPTPSINGSFVDATPAGRTGMKSPVGSAYSNGLTGLNLQPDRL